MPTFGRSLLSTAATLQAVLLLTIQLVDGGGVHRCPDHDSGLGVLALEVTHPHGHSHEGHGTPGKHQGLCPCLGACHNSVVALAPVGAAVLTGLPTLATGPAPALVAILRTPARHLLPFSIGPPRPVPFDIA